MIQVLVAPQDVAAALAGAGEAFAALQDCAATSLGLMGSKKLLLHLPLGLSSSILHGCQTGSLPAGCAGVSLIWGLPMVWRVGLWSRKPELCAAGSPLQHSARSSPCPPSSVLPCQHQDPVVSRLMAPLFFLFFPHVSCGPRGASWHSETGREESWDLHCFRCGRPLCWDFYNQQIRGGVKASLVRSQGMN